MATLRARGNTWSVDFTTAAGERVRRSLGACPRIEAERQLKEIELALMSGNVPGGKVPSFAGYVTESYHKWHEWQYPHSHFRTESVVRVQLLPHFGPLPLDGITRSTVEHWLQGRMAAFPQPKHSTVQKETRVLLAILNRAVVDGKLPRNLATGVKLPAGGESKPPRWYTAEELDRVYAAETIPAWRWTWQLLAYTGLRRAEACALPWAQVFMDSQPQRLHVLSTEQRRTKSGKWRDVPLADPAIEALHNLRELEQGGYVLPRVNPNTLTRAAERTLKRAGLDGSVHSFRHTFCSNLVRRGVSLRIVQELAGHASPQTTERYVHLRMGDKAAAVQVLNGLQSSTVTESQP